MLLSEVSDTYKKGGTVAKRVRNPVTHKYYAQQKETGERNKGQFSGLWHPPKRRTKEGQILQA